MKKKKQKKQKNTKQQKKIVILFSVCFGYSRNSRRCYTIVLFCFFFIAKLIYT